MSRYTSTGMTDWTDITSSPFRLSVASCASFRMMTGPPRVHDPARHACVAALPARRCGCGLGDAPGRALHRGSAASCRVPRGPRQVRALESALAPSERREERRGQRRARLSRADGRRLGRSRTGIPAPYSTRPRATWGGPGPCVPALTARARFTGRSAASGPACRASSSGREPAARTARRRCRRPSTRGNIARRR